MKEMRNMFISDTVFYAGVNDRKVDLFEGQYPVPNGISYNSYIIKGEKVAVMDSVDKNFGEEWLENIEKVLGDKAPAYGTRSFGKHKSLSRKISRRGCRFVGKSFRDDGKLFRKGNRKKQARG